MSDRHPMQTTGRVWLSWVVEKMRSDPQVYSLHHNPSGCWHAPLVYLQHHLIMTRRDNSDLYDWYLSCIGLKDESKFTSTIDERVKELQTDPRAPFFHIRQRDVKALSSISLAFLYSESTQVILGSGDEDLPNSFMLEIFLSGWKQQYELCGRMKPEQLLSLLPSLSWEGKFEELLWLTKQRVPYSKSDLKGFEGFKMKRRELKVIIGKDRPLLSSATNTILFPSSARNKNGELSRMEWTARTMAERAHNLDVPEGALIFSHIDIAAVKDMLITFISDQQVTYSTIPDVDVLKELIGKREIAVKMLRRSILREKEIFKECCRIARVQLLSGYGYMVDNFMIDERVKAMKNLIQRWTESNGREEDTNKK